jgi:hypothetical protein
VPNALSAVSNTPPPERESGERVAERVSGTQVVSNLDKLIAERVSGTTSTISSTLSTASSTSLSVPNALSAVSNTPPTVHRW